MKTPHLLLALVAAILRHYCLASRAAPPDHDVASAVRASARLRGSAHPSERRNLLIAPPPTTLKANQTCWKKFGVPGPGGYVAVNGTCTEAFLEACASTNVITTCAPNEQIAMANANLDYGDYDPFTVWYNNGTLSSCEWMYQPCQ